MAARIALDRLQRWMQAVVVHPGTVKQAVLSVSASRELRAARVKDVILPSKALSALERIGVYHGMYLLRMHDALADDYAALRHFMGDDSFFELVAAYVRRHPSRSYSLNRLGDHLPDFIATSAHRVRNRAFCADLARLECALAQVFDAPETEALAFDSVASVPSDAWEHARLRTVAAFRLVALRYPANAYLQSVRDSNHNHPLPRRKSEWIAVYRKDYAVWRLGLDPSAFALLRDLSQGVALGRSVRRALARGGPRRPKREDLFRWFQQWVSGGLFQAVESAHAGILCPAGV